MLSIQASQTDPRLQFHLNDEDFTKLIGAYKLKFEEQLKFNQEFGIEDEKPQDERAEELKIFLQKKLNEAFKDQEKLLSYKEQVSAQISSSERGIHDGFHGASVTLYAKKFLKIYQENRDLFSPEIQKEIAEFDDPKKARDLEILCLMHDIARVNKAPDQNEYKNAFYVALMLREMGDERFQGNEISDEGLKMIMDLASKESKDKDKSLMSKLIQASDSLAILRSPVFRDGSSVYDFNLNDVFKDFSDIDFAHAPTRDKLKKSIRELVSKISLVEKNPNILLENLECQKDPKQIFLNHKKTLLLMNSFDEALEILKTDEAVEGLPSHRLGNMFYVHAISTYSPYPLDKQGQRFICATILSSSGTTRGYADRSWRNNPVLILNQEGQDGIVFSSGFKTDIGSAQLFSAGQNFTSNIEASYWLQMKTSPYSSKSYFDKMIYTEEQMYKKIQEMSIRRKDPERDISNGEYKLLSGSGAGEERAGRVGKDRYQEDYSTPHHEIRTDSGELRHNEIHILNSTHIDHLVGMARDVFEHTPAHKMGQLSDFSHFGLLRLKFYKDQINAEKKRLLDLENPMEDEKFKNCVEFELSRVTNLFEKIGHLKKLIQELNDNPNHPLITKSIYKKTSKKTEYEDCEFFTRSPENTKIIQARKIEKLGNELEILYKNLEEFEKPESFGFKDLKQQFADLSSNENFYKAIKDWKIGIMNGENNPRQLQIAISRVKSGLQKETQMALYDIFQPQEIKILSEEEYQKKFAKTPELFRELCERKDYSSILLLYTKKEINKLSQDEVETELRNGSKLPNYQAIFSETLRNATSSKLGLLIKMGLDIYSPPDTADNEEYQRQVQCFPVSPDDTRQTYWARPYRVPESFLLAKIGREDPKVFQKLIKFGALFSEDALPYESSEQDEFKVNTLSYFLKGYSYKYESIFRDKLLNNLKKYNSENDLTTIESPIEFEEYRGQNRTMKHRITLNGYGLLRMFDKYKKLTNGDPELSNLVEKLKILRGKEPDKSTSFAHADMVYLAPPANQNSMG